jgi:NADPH-dependent 2,4-dienoyl-CoA reductase/sulfur reductase-like enzyme
MARRTWQDDGMVIVGGGLAGQRCAESLRRQGYDGPLRIVCAERHRPYDRPPLSKELLAGARDAGSISFRAAEWYEQQSIDLLLGTRATSLDVSRRRVALSDGSVLRYRWLIIASGSRPRTLRALERYENVSVLRSVEHCLSLREVLATRPRLVVLGAGFVGQEVAATARTLGAEVTMIEAAATPLASVLGPEAGQWFARLHRSQGVQVLTGCTVAATHGNGTIEALRLSNGRTIEVDHLVVGIGVEPDIRWLNGSGIGDVGGVRADRDGRTGADGVLAIGDAAATFDSVVGHHVPGSHWEAASRQAGRAARVVMGLDPGGPVLSSFWTDQYGIRIQYLGHARLADRIEVDGDPATRSFTATFLKAGRPVAGLIVDRPRALPLIRNMIEKGLTHELSGRN